MRLSNVKTGLVSDIYFIFKLYNIASDIGYSLLFSKLLFILKSEVSKITCNCTLLSVSTETIPKKIHSL